MTFKSSQDDFDNCQSAWPAFIGQVCRVVCAGLIDRAQMPQTVQAGLSQGSTLISHRRKTPLSPHLICQVPQNTGLHTVLDILAKELQCMHSSSASDIPAETIVIPAPGELLLQIGKIGSERDVVHVLRYSIEQFILPSRARHEKQAS